MAVPGYQSFLRPMLGIALKKEVSRQEYLKEIPKLLHLTKEDREERTAVAGVNVVADRASWASTYLVHAGLLRRPRRGVIIATARGKQVYRDNPDHIDEAVLQQFPEFRAWKKSTKSKDNTDGGEDAGKTPLQRIDEAVKVLNEDLRERLKDRILEATPTALELLSIRLMTAMGYGDRESSRHLGKTGDGGVDGVVLQDRLGLDAIFLQAKRNQSGNTVGVDKIHQFAGALEGKKASKGVFVTTSTFSKAAKDFAENKGQKSLVLIDGEELARLLIEHGVGVLSERKYELKRLDEDYFSDLDI